MTKNDSVNNKATHRGTCQACGRVQAMNPRSGMLAKHGYTVDWGFFNGVCVGADRKPIEHQTTLTRDIIRAMGEESACSDKRAADLRSGAIEPKFFNRVLRDQSKPGVGKYEDIECTRAEISEVSAKRQIEIAAYKAENNAAHARSHAAMLEKLIVARFDQPLYPISNKIELAVGMSVRIGGKKGKVYEVVKLDYKVAQGCGPYMNGRSMLHAFFKSSKSEALWAVPTRTIRQDAIIEKGGAQ